MTHFKLITTMLAGAAVALAQTPRPAAAPPAPPVAAQAVTPAPAAAPAPVARPEPVPFRYELITPEIEAQIEAARDQLRDFHFDFDSDAVREQMEAAREQIRALEPQLAYAQSVGRGFGLGAGAGFGNGFAFAPQIAPVPPTPPAAAARGMIRINGTPERAYSNGQSALDSRHWEDAVAYFGQVISRGTTHVDGALYWKAYALAKLGRSQESLASIAELRKSYASSRWLDDAKALELEVNQSGNKPMSADAETDEELKLLIIEHGIQTDFERFYPALEKILKSSASPKLKRNALYVLAINSSPKAQALVEQIARGGGNPDLQIRAINFMGERRRGNTNANNGQILAEIYTASTDTEVKRAALSALINANDKDRVLALLKAEKNSDLRSTAIQYFGRLPGNTELWQLYQSESSPEGKLLILQNSYSNGNADKILEVLRTEKDTKIRVQAARVLSSYKNPQIADALVSIYGTEQDPQVKSAIVDAIGSQRNGEAMVKLAKAEKDAKLKIRLVERLSNMKECKECSDYLMELLNK